MTTHLTPEPTTQADRIERLKRQWSDSFCSRRHHFVPSKIEPDDDRLHYCACRSLSVQHTEEGERVELREAVLNMIFPEGAPDG